MKQDDFLDPDDIRRRGSTDLHPVFYWRMIYNREKDNFRILPFMRINNSDSGRADWMDVEVRQKHIIRYKTEYADFRARQEPTRTEFTRSEMMHIQQFRDKYEYNKGRILLPPDAPEYEPLISDFSIRLNPEDIAILNRIDGVESEMDTPAETPAQSDNRTQSQRILDVLGIVADKLDGLDARIRKLENNQ